MTAPTKWRLNMTANAGSSFGYGVGGLELRSSVGVAHQYVRDFFTVSATNTGAASLLGTASLSTIVGAFSSYNWHTVTFPFAVILGGVSYSSCFITDDGQIEFSTDGATYGWDYFQVENTPKGFPSIFHSPGNDSGFSGTRRLYAGAENSGTTFRIRLEMCSQDTDPGSADTVWEVTFASAAPNTLRIDFGTSGYAGAAEGLIAGISDGYYYALAATFGAGVVNQGYDVAFTLTSADGTATASAADAPTGGAYGYSYGAVQAFDNTIDTYWYASGASTPWLEYEFNAPYAVVEYVVSAPSHKTANSTNQQPSAWTLEYYDGASWQVADTQTGQTPWNTYGEARTYTLSAPPSNDGDLTLLELSANGLLNVPTDTYVGGSLTMEALTLAATGLRTPDGEATLLPLSLAATGFPHHMAAGGNLALLPMDSAGALEPALPLPWLTLDASGEGGTVATGSLTLRSMIMVVGAMDAPLATEELTLDASLLGGSVAAGDNPLLTLTADADAILGNVADGAVALPLLHAEGGPEGQTVLPLLDASGAGLAGSAAVGAIDWPGLTLLADTRPDNDLPLPLLSVAGAVLQGAVGAGALTLPLLTAEGGPEGALFLPLLDAAGSALAGNLGSAGVLLDKFTLAADFGPAQGLADGTVTLPLAAADAALLTGTMSAGDAVLGRATLDAAGSGDMFADGGALLQALTLSATAFASGDGAGDITLAEWRVAASGEVSGVGAGAVQLATWTLRGTLDAGTISSGTLTLPLVSLSADGYADTVGVASVTLPLFTLAAAGVAGMASVPAPVFTGIVLNTHTKAVSNYAGLAFNSLAQFNGLLLAATSGGIVALIGEDDDGSPIAAMLASGVSDLKAEQFKRVLAGYVGYAAGGDLELTMITDSHHEYVYALQPNQLAQEHAARVKFGRGVDGRYWQWRLANRLGADFALDALTLDATMLTRRI
jgi:hypothetical protein